MRNCRVHIIESPSADDFLADQHEGAVLCAALRHGQVPVELHTTVNPQCFARALAKVIQAYKQDQDAFPILHLSMHGNETGVGLTNGDTMEWDTLGEGLSLVNEALHDKLLLAMSTCQGYEGAAMARRDGLAPFFALFGPAKDVSWKDTVAAFAAFYHHLIVRDGSIVSGVDIMNKVLREDLFHATKASDELMAWKAEKAIADQERLQRIAERIAARWRSA